MHFVNRLYHQRNIEKLAVGDRLKIPVNRFADFVHDLGVIMGSSVADVINEMTEEDGA